ncbi:hypothetical protein [Sinomonas sp. P10A9]|uniref:Mutator family transposase n=1 Tax=Sinomonas puerhi TaxID=3238584 RepID=A0AB39L2B1_9MICC
MTTTQHENTTRDFFTAVPADRLTQERDVLELARVVLRNRRDGRSVDAIRGQLRALFAEGLDAGQVLSAALRTASHTAPAAPTAPDKRTTPNQYLDADADGYRIVFGFAAVGDGEPVLELVSREQDQTEITRAEWDALKAAVDASWPERIDAD